MNRYFAAATVVAGLAVCACEAQRATEPVRAFNQAPADGNGNKSVFSFDFADSAPCGEVTITRRVQGWFQVKQFGGTGNHNVELEVFKSTLTFTNTAGETYTFRGVDADRYWVEGGQLFVALHGRFPLGNLGSLFIGTLTLNLSTDDIVFQHGPIESLPKVAACEALT